MATTDGVTAPPKPAEPARASREAREAYDEWRRTTLFLVAKLREELDRGPAVHERILRETKAREIAGGEVYLRHWPDGRTTLEQHGVEVRVYSRPDGTRYQTRELPEATSEFVRDHMALAAGLATAAVVAGDFAPVRDVGLLMRSLISIETLIRRATA